jgi:predicted permease
MLSLFGGVLGLAFAAGFLQWFSQSVAVTDSDMPYWMNFSMDYSLFGYFFLICIVTGIAFGCVPAFQISKADVNDNLKESGRGSAGGLRARRMTGALLIGEIALTVVLLAGAGLMVRSLLILNTIDLRVDTRQLIHARLQVSDSKYPEPADRDLFVETLLERLNRAGQAATIAIFPPLGGAYDQPLELRDRNIADKTGKFPDIGVLLVGNNYFQVMDVKVKRGRPFEVRDGRPGSEAAIVNERFAARYWPNENPIGKSLRFGYEKGAWFTVVGVSPDIFQSGMPRLAPDPIVYIPYRQNPWRNISVFMRNTQGIASTAALLRGEMAKMDRDLAFYSIQELDEVLKGFLTPWRIMVRLFSLFAFMALLMSSVGLYGVTAHGVNQRTREIGVRVALGATPFRVIWLILKQSVKRVTVGLALGLFGATLLTQLMESILVTKPTDTTTFATVSVVLVLVTIAASFLPAWHATRLNPVDALRTE